MVRDHQTQRAVGAPLAGWQWSGEPFARAGGLRRIVGSSVRFFAAADWHRKPVFPGGEWAGPAVVVSAGRVVGVVEIDHHLCRARRDFEAEAIRVLDRVEQVTAAAVGLAIRAGVLEGKEKAPDVSHHGEDGELAGNPVHREPKHPGPAVVDHAIFTARVDVKPGTPRPGWL